MANKKIRKIRVQNIDYDISVLAENVSFDSGNTFSTGSIGAALKDIILSINEIKDKGIFSSGLTY